VSNPVVTVLVPTFDHGLLIRHALESVLAQTVDDLELFVVGDGAPDVTRHVVAECAQRDRRVRYFDNAKGPGHGEVHRHRALGEARGRAVAYLSDDDLWFPDHLATMLALLDEADLAVGLCLKVRPAGTAMLYFQPDFALPDNRVPLLRCEAAVPLSVGAHTLAAYRRLRKGWQEPPAGVRSDQFIWQQFLARPDCRAAVSRHLTVVHLGSKHRAGMAIDERSSELAEWWQRLQEPNVREQLLVRAAEARQARAAELKSKLGKRDARIDRLQAQVDVLQAEPERRRAQITNLQIQASEELARLEES
jgi:Glycosyl transferase family 2